MSEYIVYYEGKVSVEADSDSEATQLIYDKLQDADVGEFSIIDSEEA